MDRMPQSDRNSPLAMMTGPRNERDRDVIKRIFPTFWRERRRLAFVAVLAFFAGFFFYARLDLMLFGLPAGIVTGLVYAAVIVPVALMICVFMPSVRFLIEAVAITRLILAMLVYTYPILGEVLLQNPLMTAAIVVSSGAILSRSVLHGRMTKPPVEGWMARVRQFFTRVPAHIEAPTPLQHRFTAWVDATPPVRL